MAESSKRTRRVEPPRQAYPRPVEDIDCDPIQELPGTTVYAEDSEEEGLDPTEVADLRAKRYKRIEAIAREALRGRVPYIVSARMKGPFEKDTFKIKVRKERERARARDVNGKAKAKRVPPKKPSPPSTAIDVPVPAPEPLPQSPAVTRTQQMLAKSHRYLTQTPWTRLPSPAQSTPPPAPALPHHAAATVTLPPPRPATPNNSKADDIALLSDVPNQLTSEEKASARKVDDWFRRNPALLPQHRVPEPASPTPKKTYQNLKRLAPTDKAPDPKRRCTPLNRLITVSSQDVKAPVRGADDYIQTSFDTTTDSFDSDNAANKPWVSAYRSHLVLQHAVHTETTYERVSRETAEQLVVEQQHAARAATRAEDAIVRQRQISHFQSVILSHQHGPCTSTHTGSSSDDSFHTPIRAIRPQHDITSGTGTGTVSAVKLEKLEAFIDAEVQNPSGPAPAFVTKVASKDTSAAKESDLPTIHSTSNARSTLMPSAQPRPELPVVASFTSTEILSDIDDHDVVTGLSQSPEAAAQIVVGSFFDADDQDPALKPSVTVAQDPVVSTKESVPYALDDLDRVSSSQPDEGQGTVDVVDVPECPTSKVTFGKVVAAAYDASKQGLASPGATKPRSKRKSTSFAYVANCSPNTGSIKNALKVRKLSKRAQSRNSSADKCVSSKQDVEGYSRAKVPSSPEQPHRKSILKTTTSSTSAAAPAKASTIVSSSTSRKHLLGEPASQDDLSGVNNKAGQHEDIEDFDLDGAMNELGSFLSTWNEEKTALRVH